MTTFTHQAMILVLALTAVTWSALASTDPCQPYQGQLPEVGSHTICCAETCAHCGGPHCHEGDTPDSCCLLSIASKLRYCGQDNQAPCILNEPDINVTLVDNPCSLTLTAAPNAPNKAHLAEDLSIENFGKTLANVIINFSRSDASELFEWKSVNIKEHESKDGCPKIPPKGSFDVLEKRHDTIQAFQDSMEGVLLLADNRLIGQGVDVNKRYCYWVGVESTGSACTGVIWSDPKVYNAKPPSLPPPPKERN